MRLFLASRFRNAQTIEKLRTYIGGFKDKRIAYIPTADNAETGWEAWKHRQVSSWTEINKLGAQITPVILEEYRNDSVLEVLKGKDIIWFAGGMAGYLAYWMRRCKLDLILPEIMKHNIWYVGSSAGSMVTGQTLQISNWGDVDGERGAEFIEPMKFVDFDIFPHYKDEYYEQIKSRYSGPKIYLLKDGEEIIVEDNKIEVIGEERIITGRS